MFMGLDTAVKHRNFQICCCFFSEKEERGGDEQKETGYYLSGVCWFYFPEAACKESALSKWSAPSSPSQEAGRRASAPWWLPRRRTEDRGEGGTTAGPAPAIPAFAFPRARGCATSAARAAMTPGPWWLVLWLPLLATLPADAVQEEEEAVMAGNPGSGRWGGAPFWASGSRVGAASPHPLRASFRMLHVLIRSGHTAEHRHSWPFATSSCLKSYFIRLHKSHATPN